MVERCLLQLWLWCLRQEGAGKWKDAFKLGQAYFLTFTQSIGQKILFWQEDFTLLLLHRKETWKCDFLAGDIAISNKIRILLGEEE